ncbi:MAG: PH domain-containing protein [Phycisphaerales bacterium]|nr:PH domain-containing protein [Phycisphaerales bacterium]
MKRQLQSPLEMQSGEHGAAAASPASVPMTTSLATLLTQHILRDGELVILILKPSLWFILFNSLRFIASVAILLIAAILLDPHLPGNNRQIIEIGIFIIGGRLMWSVLQWMGRLYVLTDLRILRLSGVFYPEIFDCPLRKVARARLIVTLADRIFGVGSIEIIPFDDTYPIGLWQMIAHPRQIHRQVVATIHRAKQGGLGGMAG